MSNETELLTKEEAAEAPHQNGMALVPTEGERQWALEQRKAKALASSPLVPKDYQNNIGSCLIALDMASRTGAPPLMVMQNLHIVQGRPSWSSAFLIACVNSCGRFSAMRYEERGTFGTKDYALRAVCTEKASGEVLNGTWITETMVEAEGWRRKNGSKWLTMPEQMFRYRAAAFWARAYAPEIAVGLHTAEEVQDIASAPIARTMRLTPAQMDKAKKELANGEVTIEAVEEQAPNLASDQLDELKQYAMDLNSDK